MLSPQFHAKNLQFLFIAISYAIKTKSLQNVDVKDNAQINIVNARKTILVAIASVHVIVEKDPRTEILNLLLRLFQLFSIFIVQK